MTLRDGRFGHLPFRDTQLGSPEAACHLTTATYNPGQRISLPVSEAAPQREEILAVETIISKKSRVFAGLTETQVIEKAQGGDAECFEALYHWHKRRVFSLCLRMTGNTAEAEDATQDAFLQLYRKIAQFRGESAFSTWMHRLTVNVVLMRIRKSGLVQVSLEETLEPQHEGEPPREFGARDLNLDGSLDRISLEHAIQELPPGYRIIFVLHDVEGYEHNEIAEILGCSIGNSKSQLHKARLKLRSLLGQSRGHAVQISKPKLTISMSADLPQTAALFC